MKGASCTALRVRCWAIQRAVSATRDFGKGKVSTTTIALILTHPDKLIRGKTARTTSSCSDFRDSLPMHAAFDNTPCSVQIAIEFPTAARACVREKRRTRTAVENSLTAVQLPRTVTLPRTANPPVATGDLTN